MSKKSEEIRSQIAALSDEEVEALANVSSTPITPSVPTFVEGDFVAAISNPDMRGRVEAFQDNKALVRIFEKLPDGRWEASLKKAMIPTDQLAASEKLPLPESTYTPSAGTRPFKVLSRTNDTAEIAIYSDIGAGFFGGMDANMFNEQLKALGNIKTLDIRLNSGGGDVFEGITIYNRLKQFPAKVRVFVDGIAASIASVIAMAADEIYVFDTSTFMVHKPWSYTGGNADELLAVVDRLNMVEEQMLSIYTNRTGLSKERVQSLLRAETWMSGEEAVNLGFADYLDDASMAMAAAVRKDFNKTWFAHAPTSAPQPKEISEKRRKAAQHSAYLKARGFV